MVVGLVIPPCGETPKHQHHLPPVDIPLRISIGAYKADVQRLIPSFFPPPDVDGNIPDGDHYDEAPAVEFAKLAFAEVFGRPPSDHTPGDFVFQQVGFGGEGKVGEAEEVGGITYYDMTFDHLVPAGEDNPEVLQLNTITLVNSKYSKIQLFEYAAVGNVILLPRCCQTRVGSTDRGRVNDMVRLVKESRQQHEESIAEDI